MQILSIAGVICAPHRVLEYYSIATRAIEMAIQRSGQGPADSASQALDTYTQTHIRDLLLRDGSQSLAARNWTTNHLGRERKDHPSGRWTRNTSNVAGLLYSERCWRKFIKYTKIATLEGCQMFKYVIMSRRMRWCPVRRSMKILNNSCSIKLVEEVKFTKSNAR